ncbi:nucleoside deaminase [Desemzia sp. RIT804]|uniref:nucleoside deaminase n=1 Tax=Desemzia sp. RIT 804 TaxID=2810209 RepID=UPI0019524B3B|nr:nucleoside deaminase [Desemzia sp. RIT 804]MBM6613566.1 nucleoside deaminase [Desemzia sp. RIT 804]
MDQLMKRAVDLALENVQEGGRPFGAVLTKDGKIIAEGVNELHKIHDVSGHAELLTIRRAQQRLETHDLTGYTMYASGEPCSMCMTAMYFAGINNLYYCQSLEETISYGMKDSAIIYDELKKERSERMMNSQYLPLEAGQENPMKLWQEKNK